MVVTDGAVVCRPARRGSVRSALGGRWRRRSLPRSLAAVCWVVVVVLLVIAGARVIAWDALEPFVVANALTAVLYLPAWIVALLGLFGRRYLLGVLALVVVAAQLVFLAPELAAATPVPSWAAGSPHLRLLDANVSDGNEHMAGYAREIRAERPALVTMEEATPRDAVELERDGALDRLPYRYEVDRFDPWAFLVASKYRLGPTKVVSLYGRPLLVETVLHLPSGALSVWIVHTVAPLPWSWRQWKGQLGLLASLVARRGAARLLLLGDFNATWGNKAFKALLATGLTDGAAARGDALDMTWSQTIPLLPPLLRIDHVLTGRDLTVTTISAQDGPGSDHRDELATVAVRAPDPRSRVSRL